jgi:SAM-dependent methyltransferase
MQANSTIKLPDVQAVYSGPEGRLWELLMGEQIHIGGWASSTDLADQAGVGKGQKGVDLCCASGAGMRFLTRVRGVNRMTGVDATPTMLELGRSRCVDEGLGDRIEFVEADVCDTGLSTGQYDFVWGEDAWCYVEDKPRLIAEAARLVKPGGTIAFTDWVLGATAMSAEEAKRYLTFMKFPNVFSLDEYGAQLTANSCEIIASRDTGRFAEYVPLYLDMVEKQLTYDALKIIEFNQQMAGAITGEMRFMQTLADAGKIAQGLIVARKSG